MKQKAVICDSKALGVVLRVGSLEGEGNVNTRIISWENVANQASASHLKWMVVEQEEQTHLEYYNEQKTLSSCA